VGDEDRIIDRFIAMEHRQMELLGPEEYERQRGPKYRATLRQLIERSAVRGISGLRENQRLVNDAGEIYLERLPPAGGK